LLNGFIEIKINMLTWNIILFLISLYILVKASQSVVKYILAIADFLNISDYVAALLIMSLATTLPEFVVGINSAIGGFSNLSLGNLFGANIANISLVLGLSAFLSGNIKTVGRAPKYHIWPALLTSISPIILLLDGSLTRNDGLILISIFFIYCFFLIFGRSFIKKEHDILSKIRSSKEKTTHHYLFLNKNIGGFIISVFLLLLSAYVLTLNASSIALSLNISEILIGIFVIAIGTTLPELSISLRSAFSKHPGLSIGNLVGASVFNSTLILGVVALINPIAIIGNDFKSFIIASIFMVLCIIVANIFLTTGRKIGRFEGLMLMFIYVLFIFSNIIL